MGEQTTLPTTDTLGKPPARFGAVTTFPQMDNYSTSTGHRIVHGHVKATGAKAWDLWLDPKPGANAGVLVVQFPDDSAAINVFIEKYGLTFPEPSYRCDVKFTVVWRKVRYGNRPGSTNVVQTIELLPEDTVTDQVADKTTLKTEFPRDDDNQPADHWIDDKGARGAFWAKVTPWIKWAGWDGKPEDFVHDKIGKLHDWTSGQQAAVERLAKEAILIRWNGTGRELGKGDFQAAVGYATLIAAWQSGLTDNEIRNLIDAHLAQPAPQTPAPEAPPAGATDAGGIPLPDAPQIASGTPSEPQNGHVASGMSEAGFSMNFFWCDADGAETQFTMREVTWQAGLENVEKFKAGLRALGYMPKAEYARQHSTPAPGASAPAQATMPAPAPAPSANGNGGEVRITAVKKITDEGKTRYELFASMDQDKPEITVRLDSMVNGILAKHIGVNDMEIGKRYAVTWNAAYKNTTKFSKTANRDVTYRDLTGITPAA